MRQLVDSGMTAEREYVEGVPHGHANIPGRLEALSSIERMAALEDDIRAGGYEGRVIVADDLEWVRLGETSS